MFNFSRKKLFVLFFCLFSFASVSYAIIPIIVYLGEMILSSAVADGVVYAIDHAGKTVKFDIKPSFSPGVKRVVIAGGGLALGAAAVGIFPYLQSVFGYSSGSGSATQVPSGGCTNGGWSPNLAGVSRSSCASYLQNGPQLDSRAVNFRFLGNRYVYDIPGISNANPAGDFVPDGGTTTGVGSTPTAPIDDLIKHLDTLPANSPGVTDKLAKAVRDYASHNTVDKNQVSVNNLGASPPLSPSPGGKVVASFYDVNGKLHEFSYDSHHRLLENGILIPGLYGTSVDGKGTTHVWTTDVNGCLRMDGVLMRCHNAATPVTTVPPATTSTTDTRSPDVVAQLQKNQNVLANRVTEAGNTVAKAVRDASNVAQNVNDTSIPFSPVSPVYDNTVLGLQNHLHSIYVASPLKAWANALTLTSAGSAYPVFTIPTGHFGTYTIKTSDYSFAFTLLRFLVLSLAAWSSIMIVFRR